MNKLLLILVVVVNNCKHISKHISAFQSCTVCIEVPSFYKSDMDIFTYKEYTIYRSKVFLTQTNTIINKDLDILSDKTYDKGFKYQYFVTKASIKKGINIRDTAKWIHSVDSFKSSESVIFNVAPLYDTLRKIGHIFEKVINKENVLISIYKDTKFGIEEKDSASFFFTKEPSLLNIDYSLSPSLDSLKKGKFYKLVFFVYGDKIAKEQFRRNNREFIVEIKPLSINDEEKEKIINLTIEFDKEMAKYNK